MSTDPTKQTTILRHVHPVTERTKTTDTYAIVRARLTNGLRIGDADIVQLCDEIERLREFVREVSEAPDAMVCRMTRDAAKQVLS